MEDSHQTRPVVAIRTPPARAAEFLDRLQKDDEFRARLETDPAEVLGEYEIVAPEELTDEPVTLPTKEEISEAIRAMDAGELVAIGDMQRLSDVLWWLARGFRSHNPP